MQSTKSGQLMSAVAMICLFGCQSRSYIADAEATDLGAESLSCQGTRDSDGESVTLKFFESGYVVLDKSGNPLLQRINTEVSQVIGPIIPAEAVYNCPARPELLLSGATISEAKAAFVLDVNGQVFSTVYDDGETSEGRVTSSPGQVQTREQPPDDYAAKRNNFTIKTRPGVCGINFEPGAERDQSFVTKRVLALEEKIASIFEGIGFRDILERAPECENFFAAKPFLEVSSGTALGFQRRSSFIFMLAPSALGEQNGRYNMARDPYWEKVFAHEYFQGALYMLNSREQTKYQLDSCPGWFLQGLQEYAGLSMTSAGTLAIWKGYLADAQDMLSATKFSSAGIEFKPRNTREDQDQFAYFFGAAFVRWLVETKGMERALKVAAAVDKATCEAEITNQFGSPETWQTPFERWLRDMR